MYTKFGHILTSKKNCLCDLPQTQLLAKRDAADLQSLKIEGSLTVAIKQSLGPCNSMISNSAACSFGWWLMAGADLL
jgi:hypothetical protein